MQGVGDGEEHLGGHEHQEGGLGDVEQGADGHRAAERQGRLASEEVCHAAGGHLEKKCIQNSSRMPWRFQRLEYRLGASGVVMVSIPGSIPPRLLAVGEGSRARLVHVVPARQPVEEGMS